MTDLRIFLWYLDVYVAELVAGSGGLSPARTAHPAGEPSWFQSIVFIGVRITVRLIIFATSCIARSTCLTSMFGNAMPSWP